MKEAKILDLNGWEIGVKFSGKKVELPKDIQIKIDKYWETLIAEGKKEYFRGDVFTVTEAVKKSKSINVLVEKTDFAHYLYCHNIDPQLAGFGMRGIHPSCLVETADEKTIFGQMADWTSRKGILQLCGGGIDSKDLKGDIFDFEHCIKKELLEELGIDAEDGKRVSSFEKKYLKEGGPTDKLSLIYRLVLNEDSQTFLEKYADFVKSLVIQNKLAEFDRLIVLDKNNKKEIEDFFSKNQSSCDEYMEPLFRFCYL